MNDHILSQDEIDALLRSREGNGGDGNLDEAVLNEIFMVAVRAAEGSVAEFLGLPQEEIDMAEFSARAVLWDEVSGMLLTPGLALTGDLSGGVEGVVVAYSPKEAGELAVATFAEEMPEGDPSEFAQAWTEGLLDQFAHGVVEGLATVLSTDLKLESQGAVEIEDPTAEDAPLPFGPGEMCVEVTVNISGAGEIVPVHILMPGDVVEEILRILGVEAQGETQDEVEDDAAEMDADSPEAGDQAAEAPTRGRAEKAAGGAPSRVEVEPAQFAALDRAASVAGAQNIGLILDVPLQVTVELGRTRKQIKEILELGKGSVIQLEKLAGEMVDILVNGKLIARGEVVVIDENFGVKITDIVSPVERVQNLQ